MDKKGAELSMNVIIIAAIALIVLIVLIIIFSGRVGQFSESSSEATSREQAKVCMANGGRCVDAATGGNCQQQKEGLNIANPLTYDWIDCTKGQVCCFS